MTEASDKAERSWSLGSRPQGPDHANTHNTPRRQDSLSSVPSSPSNGHRDPKVSYRYSWQGLPGSWKGVTWYVVVLLIGSPETPEHTMWGAEVLKPRLPQRGRCTSPRVLTILLSLAGPPFHLSLPSDNLDTQLLTPREKLSLHFTSQHWCLKTNQSF